MNSCFHSFYAYRFKFYVQGILQNQLEGSSISILDLLKIGAENHYPFVNLVEHLSLVLFDLLTN